MQQFRIFCCNNFSEYWVVELTIQLNTRTKFQFTWLFAEVFLFDQLGFLKSNTSIRIVQTGHWIVPNCFGYHLYWSFIGNLGWSLVVNVKTMNSSTFVYLEDLTWKNAILLFWSILKVLSVEADIFIGFSLLIDETTNSLRTKASK